MDDLEFLHWVGDLVERERAAELLARSVQSGVLRQIEELESMYGDTRDIGKAA